MSTTYMNLNLPTPSVTTGPEWAEKVNTAVTTIDAHDHSPGKGTPVPTSGLNINADLSVGSNKLTNVKSVNLTPETASLPAANVQAVYSFSGDLWYNNSSGTPVQITQGDSITNASTPLIPSGVIWEYGGVSAPSGFLMCDGSAVSRTSFANLFAAIGDVFGAGDGTTTFNLPDRRGRTGVGAGTYTDPVSGAITRTLGQKLGAEKHLLTSDEMPSHNHLQNPHNHSVNDPGHSHEIPVIGNTGVFNNTANFSVTTQKNVTSSATTGVSVNGATATNQATGGSQVHNNMQPSIGMNYIIKI